MRCFDGNVADELLVLVDRWRVRHRLRSHTLWPVLHVPLHDIARREMRFSAAVSV